MSWWKKKPEDPAVVEFNRHIQRLGLATTEEYVRWCKDNGFSTGIMKSEDVRKKEVKYLREKVISEAFEKGREAHLPLHKRINLYLEKGREDSQIKSYKEEAKRYNFPLDQFLKFMLFLDKETKLLEDKTLSSALILVFTNREHWIRSVDSYKVKTKNSQRQFSQLLRHLFSKYKIPEFMDAAWINPHEGQVLYQNRAINEKYIQWFLHLAKGQNLRTAPNLPFPMTKAMVHHCLQAPSSMSIAQALRYGQMKTMGANKRLIESTLQTHLGRVFVNEEFWKTFLDFICQQEFFDPSLVGNLVDYIQHQKFSPNAPQPNLAMRGRSLQNLVAESEAWHLRIQKVRGKHYEEWKPQAALPFSKEEKSGEKINLWTVEELTNSKALEDEGRTMKHCVASYRYSCSKGTCSIWSVKLNGTRMATIELSNQTKTVVQAKAKMNAPVEAKAFQTLREWAAMNGYALRVYER